MQHTREKTPKERFTEALSEFLHRFRFVLIGLLAAIIVFVIVYFVATEIRNDRIEQSTARVERVEQDFESWLTNKRRSEAPAETAAGEDVEAEEEDSQSPVEADERAQDILRRLNDIIESYPNLYSAQRALYVRGRYYFETEQWNESAASFVALADRFPKSYLASISLINAAISMEEAENFVNAVSYYERTLDEYVGDTPEIPAVLFSLGRLHEQMSEPESARTYYERILDEYPSSGWTNIAQTRIIYLNLD